jgi:hypothetical protein
MSRYFVVAFPKGREALSRDIAFQDATLRATERDTLRSGASTQPKSKLRRIFVLRY